MDGWQESPKMLPKILAFLKVEYLFAHFLIDTAQQLAHLKLGAWTVGTYAVVLFKAAIEVILDRFFTRFFEFANLDELFLNIGMVIGLVVEFECQKQKNGESVTCDFVHRSILRDLEFRHCLGLLSQARGSDFGIFANEREDKIRKQA